MRPADVNPNSFFDVNNIKNFEEYKIDKSYTYYLTVLHKKLIPN